MVAGSRLRIGILGPLHVENDDGPLQITAPKQRELLALLALHRGHSVGVEQLVDALWSDDPPRSATKTLQTYISGLRRILPDESLRTVPGGYELVLAGEDFDADVFEALTKSARRKLTGGELAGAAELLEEGLALWRGRALADMPGGFNWVAAGTRLDELRRVALEDLADIRMEAGADGELIAELEAAVSEEPLRERRWAQLMTGLYRSGRQADALRAYRRLQEHLSNELGIEPSVELAQLEQAVLLQDPSLDWVRSDAFQNDVGPTNVPLPSRLAQEPEVGIVGRLGELEVLHSSLKRVSAGDGRELILIAGEAGVGKTTIAAMLARNAHRQGACVLFGRCQEETGAPYQPFSEALGSYVTTAPDELLASHVDVYGPNLGLMIPALCSRLGIAQPSSSTDPEAERYLLFAVAVDLLVRASKTQTVVVVVDDLQWADKPSLQLLRHVVTSLEPLRLLIVVTCRNTELSQSDPLVDTLAGLRREPGIGRIDLKGLDDADVVTFLERSKGDTLNDADVGLAEALYRETDGNPFFVTEVLHHLADTGRFGPGTRTTVGAEIEAEGWLLPDSVREVVGARVVRLGEPARQTLALASVMGRDFNLELLASVSHWSEDELLDVLDGAIAAGLVREVNDVSGHFSFTHALIRRTLYDDIGPTRRSRLHRAIAEALEATGRAPSAAEVRHLAHHWFQATQPVDASKAIEYARRAAEAALDALAPDEALRYYGQAMQLHALSPDADPLLGVDLRIGWGIAQRQVGAGEYRTTLLDAAAEAERLGATDRVVAAALANSRGFYSAVGGVDHERIGQLERALDALGEDRGAHAGPALGPAGAGARAGERPAAARDTEQ